MDSQAPDNSVPSQSAVTEHMAELQVRKLDLEIEELSRPWWKKPAYLSALFPLFVGVLAVFVAYNRGFFDTQAALLELRRERLQRDVNTFTAERNRLITDNKNLLEKNADLTAEREQLLADQKNLRDQAVSVESQRFALSGQLALITLRGNIKELSNAIGTKGSDVSWTSLTLLTGTYGLARNPFYQTIVSELKKNDGNQRDRIKLVSQEVETHDSNPLLRGFLLTALAEATKDSSWRDKLFKLTIDNEFPATSISVGSPFLDLVMQGPFTISEKANVLVQLAASVQDRKTDLFSSLRAPYRLFLIANQSPEVLDACVRSPLVDAIRVNRDLLLTDMNATITQETEELKLKAVKHFHSTFYLHWVHIAKLSPQAGLVYLAQIAVKTGQNMLAGRALEDGPLGFSTDYETRDVFKPIYLKLLLSPWPEPPFPRQTEIGQLTFQYWAKWLKQNHQIAEVWLDPQLDVISRNPALLRKVNRRQWIKSNEIP
jgi:hypothetical protein